MLWISNRRSNAEFGSQFWKEHCGFLDISGSEFFNTQERLLADQLESIGDIPGIPESVKLSTSGSIDRFRGNTRLTTYTDYDESLTQLRHEGIDRTWAFTMYGAGREKWIPFTDEALAKLTRSSMASIVLSASERPGDVPISPGDRVVYNIPPRPYLAGHIAMELQNIYGLKGVIAPEDAEQMDFRERTQTEFTKALEHGVDILISMTSVLSKISDKFSQKFVSDSSENGQRSLRATSRYALASLKARMGGRQLQPSDLWKPKSIVGWGLDTRFFSDEIKSHWGRAPYELYASTEVGCMGLQYRDDGGIALDPESCFFEFIPESEFELARTDPEYMPRTALLDEVRPGCLYEVVVTSFYGMPFVRYRTGHTVRFSSGHLGYGPELEYVGRADERIDIGGFTRIDESTVWRAVADVEPTVRDWALRRETVNGATELHMYAEAVSSANVSEITERLHSSLKSHDPLYADLESMLGIHPLKVTLLGHGAFDRYYDYMRKAGAELMARRPKRMNADDETIERLLQLNVAVEEGAA